MTWIKVGSFLLLIGVAAGAFGAHALKGKFNAYQSDIFKTGILYQLIHSLGLFAVGILSVQFSDPKINWAGMFLTAGIIFFSGSLYLLALTQIKWLGAVTPLGGLAFLIGWALLLFSKLTA